jgi:Fimbrial assembly protein (PilN)
VRESIWDTLVERLAVFFRWWGGELWALMPPGFRRRYSSHPDCVKVTVSAIGETTPALASLQEGQLVELHLEPEVVLSHDIRLPVANHRATDGMAKIQMGRVMPLAMAELYTYWRSRGLIENLRDGTVQQNVCLYVAKRKVLGPLFELIQSRRLLLADILLNEQSGFSTLSPPQIRRHYNHRTLRTVGLSVLAALMIITLPYAWVWNVRSENEAVLQEQQALRDLVDDVSASRELIDAHDERVGRLNAERSNDWFAEVLAMLSTESPDTVLLRELNYERGSVRVAGFAESAADWALRLGEVAGVADVKLERVSAGRSPGDPENFDIVIELENGLAP